MEFTYTIEKNGMGNDMVVCRFEDGSQIWIPMKEDNSDYQAYLRWLNGKEEPNGTL